MKNVRQIALTNLSSKHASIADFTDLMVKNALSHKDVDKLYNQCRVLQFEIAKAKYMGGDTKVLAKKLADTKTKLYALLEKYNIDKNNLKTKYNCDKCKDSGILPNGNDCECLKREISDILLNESGVNKQQLPTFDDTYFKIFGEHEKDVRKIYETLHTYCNTSNTTKKIVTISGAVGVGKTHLIECMVNEYLKQNKYVIYTTAVELNNDMLRYHTSPIHEKGDYLQKYFDCDILFIDDLGTESILKNVTNEYLYQILSERTRAGKSIVITTNLDLQQIIDTYDERIFSRIANQNICLLINMIGDDLRIKK